MKRRGSVGSGQRLGRVAVAAVFALFVIANIYIFQETRRAAASRAEREGAANPEHKQQSPPGQAPSSSGHGGGPDPSSNQGQLDVEFQASSADSHHLARSAGEVAASSKADIGSVDKGSPAFLHNRSVWPFDDLDDWLKATVDKKFWGPQVPVLPDGHFDFSHGTYDKDSIREAYDVEEQVFKQTGCNSINVPFLNSEDDGCVTYLTTMANWKMLKPLPMEFDQRTIKFEAVFHEQKLHDGQHRGGVHLVKSILKVPQRLFPNEAFSEVASYHADRVMQINRIPPTGWVCIPEDMIRRSVEQFAGTTETVDEFLQESGAANYSDWIEKDLFDYARDAKLFSHTSEHDGRRKCIFASIQLKVADVFHLLDSALKIPYKAHNDSWHRYFDLSGQRDADGRPSFAKEPFAPSLLHISELCTFDYAIGNGDRSPNKNNFVVGACTRKSECADRGHGKFYVYHPNHPTYVHLDQGMGFYGAPKRNPIKDSMLPKGKNEADAAPPTFCFFRAPLLSRFEALVQEEEVKGKKVSLFERMMWEILPKGIRHYVTERKLKQSADNMRAVLGLARRCLAQPSFAPYVLGP